MPDALSYRMKTLSGPEVDLEQYRGQVVLAVNVASECGFTPQYRGLENLHERYGSKGLKILGFPSNDFGKQEPGTDDEIRSFCQTNYGVRFDMFSKVSVKGTDKVPFYAYLTSRDTNPASPGEVAWNFEKFLIGRNGQIAGRFPSSVEPESTELVEAIEAALRI